MTQCHPALASSSAPKRARLLAVAAAALLAACGGDGGGGGVFFPPPNNGGGTEPPAPKVQALSTLHGATKDVAIEFHEGTNMAASPSPDGKRVVFSAQGALWVVPIEGGKATRITSWEMEPSVPVWSPDGSRIAFQNYDGDGFYRLWTIKPNGAEPTRITSGLFDDREPAWMPDSQSLVFSSDRSQDRQTKIWRVNIATREYAALTQGQGGESNPSVSPDGKMLAFADGGRIYTKLIGSTDAAKLAGQGSLPSWLPDSMGLALQRTAASPSFVTNVVSPLVVFLPQLAGIPYTESGTTLVVGGKEVAAKEDLFPFPVRWLPDGRYLYTADGKIKIRSPGGGQVKDVPFSATLELRRPQFAKSRDRGFDQLGEQPVRGISGPVISPDGKSVAFLALNDIWVMKIGEAPVRLTHDKDRDGSPQFTPDGSAVYFSSEKGNGGALAIDKVVIATKARTRLAAIAGKSLVLPRMSPDGSRLAYTTGGGTLEVWDLGSGKTQKLTDPVRPQAGLPQWTPDGKKLIMVEAEPQGARPSLDTWGQNKLRVVDVASGAATFFPVADRPQQISDRVEGAPVLSPDGTQMAFIMDSVLYVIPMKPDGSPGGPAKTITTEAADMPSWAGDSRTILYRATDKLKTISADGSGATEVPVDLKWKQAVSPGTTVVRAGQLWSGKDGNLQSDVDIVIKANRITAIQPHDEAVAKAADKYVDASGLTVMPGLWDAHIHPLSLYRGGQHGQASAALLAYGITSTQSVGGPLHQSIEMREALAAGNMVGPRMFVSPQLWDGNSVGLEFARTIRTPEVADLEIAKASALGVDYLKAYTRAPLPIMHRIAQAAMDLGVGSGTHLIAPGAAVGLAGTTHLSGPPRSPSWSASPSGLSYQDAIDVYGKGDFHLITTSFFSTWLVGDDPAMVSDDRFKLLTLPMYVDLLKSIVAPNADAMALLRREFEQVARVQRAGGLVALGTDSPMSAPGVALQTSLRAAGLVSSNLQALQNATINAARMSLVDKDLGTVEVGKLADLTIVRGNPLADLKAAADVRYVVKNGVTQSLDEILAPFRTPAALAMRQKTLLAYQRLCRAEPHACDSVAAGHGHLH